MPGHPRQPLALQTNKHGDGQVYRWNSSQNSLVFNSAAKQDRKMGSRSTDKRTLERLWGLYSLSSPGQLGLGSVGGRRERWASPRPRALQNATPARKLCPFTATEWASSSDF